MARPNTGDYGPFYQGYIDSAKGESIQELIAKHSTFIKEFILSIGDDKADYAYAENKWTIKQMIQHLIDAERVFTYRALRFSRKDSTPLAGFDENNYAQNAIVSHRSFSDLKTEFLLLRESSDLLVQSFTAEQLAYAGVASEQLITVNAICYIIVGHSLHHIRMMQERYL